MQRQYELLYGDELQQRIASEPIAWVPLGILERHGEHLPYGLDALKAHGVCLWLAHRLGGVVLPASHLAGVHEPWFGEDVERYKRQRRLVGNFYLRAETFEMLLEDTVEGLANLGFKVIVLYTGHYPQLQVDLVRKVARAKTIPGTLAVVAFHEPDALDGQGDHAGKYETSLYLALGGEVRLDKIRPEHADQIGFFSSQRPLPTDGSREFGEAALQRILAHLSAIIAKSAD